MSFDTTCVFPCSLGNEGITSDHLELHGVLFPLCIISFVSSGLTHPEGITHPKDLYHLWDSPKFMFADAILFIIKSHCRHDIFDQQERERYLQLYLPRESIHHWLFRTTQRETSHFHVSRNGVLTWITMLHVHHFITYVDPLGNCVGIYDVMSTMRLDYKQNSNPYLYYSVCLCVILVNVYTYIHGGIPYSFI